MNTFHKIIKDICLEENIEFKTSSKDWIINLKKNNKTRFINGYKFDINNHGIGLIFDDKYSTYEVLKSFNIPVIEHRIVYSNDNNNEYARGLNTYQYLEDLYNKFNKNIVIKINNGSCGTGLLHITNKNELKQIYDEFSSKYSSFSICTLLESA